MGFNVGDKVHVEFDAVVEDNGSFGSGRMYTQKLTEITEQPGYKGTVHYVYLHKDNAEVIDPEPASWPPQVGDVWEADGHEYFVYSAVFGGTTVFPFNGNASLNFYSDDSYSTGNNFDKFKALKPKLIRRRTDYATNLSSYLSDYLNLR